MSFSFNFELVEEDKNESISLSSYSNPSKLSAEVQTKSKQQGLDTPTDAEEAKTPALKSAEPAVEVKTFYDESMTSKLSTKVMVFNEHVLCVVDTNNLEQLIQSDEEFKAAVRDHASLADIVSHSDLVDKVYEGGLKVWECGIDLTTFLSSHSLGSTLEITGKRVLELGCGAGLPGLYCIKDRAACVDFQDYNIEVLKLLTHTNVRLNTEDEDEKDLLDVDCHYYSGDWDHFCSMDTHLQKYDLILSAETIYNVANYSKLHRVCNELLSADGVVLIAAKEYYFGVGGGVDSFLEFVTAQNCFDYETVWETKKGVPRKILMLQRITNKTS